MEIVAGLFGLLMVALGVRVMVRGVVPPMEIKGVAAPVTPSQRKWPDPKNWPEVKLTRAAGLGVMWIGSGLLSLVARAVRHRLIEKNARRLGKGGPDAKKH